MRLPFLILTAASIVLSRRHYSSELENSIEDVGQHATAYPQFGDPKKLAKVLPSREAVEQFGVKFLDAIIKKGQMEMAKGAFKTQLEVLEKVNPDQFRKYKNLKVEDLAADAVMQQAQLASMQPKTGNAFVDMLHENGIPIGSSIKGIEQALKTQKEIENNDPSEQIAKAVFDKFREQILPGLVANMISGRNPFKMPGAGGMGIREGQVSPDVLHQQALTEQASLAGGGNGLRPIPLANPATEMRMAEASESSQTGTGGGADRDEVQQLIARNKMEQKTERSRMERQLVDRMMMQRLALDRGRAEAPFIESPENFRRRSPPRNSAESSLEGRLRSSPRLAALLSNPEVADVLYSRSRRLRDEPIGRSLSDRKHTHYNPIEVLGARSALALGMTEPFDSDEDEEDEEEDQMRLNSLRRSPISLNSEFVRKLSQNPELAEALRTVPYRVDDVDRYLKPKEMAFNPNPQPGLTAPRKIPTRARKMLPLLVGVPSEGTLNTPFGPIRRKENPEDSKPDWQHESRAMKNLHNNPNIAPLFMDRSLDRILKGRQLLTPEQKGFYKKKEMTILPRMFGTKMTGEVNEIDKQIKQVIEERPIPPLVFIPRGRHTRLRWTGATEKEVPGMGARFIVPSLDPTVPAMNTAYSTQGRVRDEWDTMFKVPNNWNAGDEVGFSVKQKSERFLGGTGNMDMPAANW